MGQPPTPLKTVALGLLVAFGSALGLLAAEIALRLTPYGADRGGVFTANEAEFERIPGIFSPGQAVVVRQIRELTYRVNIDSLGYRGANFPRAKGPGELRILFAGDSFVFGDFVDNEETLPAQLEQFLSARCDGPVHVVNAGLGGSTIRDQTRLIERAMTIEPDIVVLQFSENDVRDLAGISMWEELAGNRAAKSRFPMSVIYPLVRETALWNLALKAVAVLRERRTTRSLEAQTIPADGLSERASSEPPTALNGGGSAQRDDDPYRFEYRTSLDELRASLEEMGVPFIFTIFPSHLSVYRLWESDQLEWLGGAIDEVGIDAVSFLSPMTTDGRTESELYLLPRDGHPSPQGYRVAAEYLGAALVERPLPAGGCS